MKQYRILETIRFPNCGEALIRRQVHTAPITANRPKVQPFSHPLSHFSRNKNLQFARMVNTEALRADKLFSVTDHVCVVTGGGTGIGLMWVAHDQSWEYVKAYENSILIYDGRATQALAANGARVYITGRRKEVLENAAKSHDPSGGGEIIPWVAFPHVTSNIWVVLFWESLSTW